MEIDVGFIDQVKKRGPIAAPRGIKSVSLSGESGRKLMMRMERQHLANRYKMDLDAAMTSLAAANSEIDALKAELEKSRTENASLSDDLKRERDKNTSNKKAKQQKVQAQKPAAEPETPADPPAGLFEASSK